MGNKVARRRIDGTYDFLTLLVPIIIMAPLLVVITIICSVELVLASFNQRIYLRGQKATGTIISLPGNEGRRGLTLKEEGTTYNDINRQTRILNVSVQDPVSSRTLFIREFFQQEIG